MDLYSSRTLPVLTDLLVAAGIVLCAGVLLLTLGCGGKPAEVVTAAAEQDVRDKKITFTMPLEYTATVTQCNHRDGCKTRYYHPRQK